jgi:tRNA(His) guanylyltransferase
MNDSLGDRMKENYENRTRSFLPRRSYTLIRIDGKAFHTYTKGLKRPFSDDLIEWMDDTAIYLCKNIMGCRFAYVQSDEISLLLTDFDDIKTQAWFDNNLQKMCSISASMATSSFNFARLKTELDRLYEEQVCINSELLREVKKAEFDSRVWQIPQKTEVMNYFLFRQQDATRNSISSVAQSLYSHKELNKKNSNELQELIFQKGINWNDYPAKYKRGRMIVKEAYIIEDKSPNAPAPLTQRTRWISTEPPIFTEDRNYLDLLIPNNY